MVRFIRGLFTIMAGIGVMTPMMHAAEPTSNAGTVFVMTNAADKNEIIAFNRGNDGSFNEGHRYNTGGRGSAGVTDPLESQGSLTLSQDHSLLFAVNAGSGDVSVFRILRNGFLFLADKEPSGGSEPVAVAQRQNLVYVLNAGGQGRVAGFQVDQTGHLRSIDNATAFLTATVTGGASITISPDGQFLAVTERLANNIDIFSIQADGTLAPIVVNPSPAPGAFSASFAPDGKLIVSETGPANAVNGSAISSYSVVAGGTIAAVSQSVPTFGGANCWNVITPNGKFVYVSNAGSATISGFAIGNGGVLTPIGSTVVGTNPAGSTNLDITTSNDGKYVFTLNSGAGTIGVFAVQQDGTLNNVGEVEGLPKSAGFNGIAAL
jgi:6-phosphogluconolactonase (cycloisomerase 2 family)